MGRKRRRATARQAERMKKDKKHQREQRKKDRKARKNAVTLEEPMSHDLRIEPSITLSSENYRVYIISVKNTVGYFGVSPNGLFKHSIIDPKFSETEILILIKNYIRTNLKLIPIVYKA